MGYIINRAITVINQFESQLGTGKPNEGSVLRSAAASFKNSAREVGTVAWRIRWIGVAAKMYDLRRQDHVDFLNKMANLDGRLYELVADQANAVEQARYILAQAKSQLLILDRVADFMTVRTGIGHRQVWSDQDAWSTLDTAARAGIGRTWAEKLQIQASQDAIAAARTALNSLDRTTQNNTAALQRLQEELQQLVARGGWGDLDRIPTWYELVAKTTNIHGDAAKAMKDAEDMEKYIGKLAMNDDVLNRERPPTLDRDALQTLDKDMAEAMIALMNRTTQKRVMDTEAIDVARAMAEAIDNRIGDITGVMTGPAHPNVVAVIAVSMAMVMVMKDSDVAKNENIINRVYSMAESLAGDPQKHIIMQAATAWAMALGGNLGIKINKSLTTDIAQHMHTNNIDRNTMDILAEIASEMVGLDMFLSDGLGMGEPRTSEAGAGPSAHGAIPSTGGAVPAAHDAMTAAHRAGG